MISKALQPSLVSKLKPARQIWAVLMEN